MAQIHYYMTVFPTEALIASMLDPEQFGSYMATGSKRGSHEQLVFIELKGEFGDRFDWAYARSRTVPHRNGEPKHSVYLSVYRVLEHVPLEQLGTMYLTTSDGRTIGIDQSAFPADPAPRPYHLYQGLCPVQPLVISAMPLGAYGDYMVSENCKIRLPAICYCDLKVVDIADPVNTGNLGPIYNRNLGHLEECIKAVSERGKLSKTLERTFAGSFTYQIVKSGFAVVTPEGKAWYAMPSLEELVEKHYDWARSAMLV